MLGWNRDFFGNVGQHRKEVYLCNGKVVRYTPDSVFLTTYLHIKSGLSIQYRYV